VPAPADVIERRLWHPVSAVDAVGERPLAVRLLEHDIVLWRDASGALRAFDDRCPHRGAQLSLGRRCGDALECAYHGWRFDGAGRCVAVPAQPGFVPPATHLVASHALATVTGLVWLRLDAGEGGAPPVFDFEHDPALRRLLVGPYDVATSAPRVVENFLDLAHFGFVHEGLLGDRAHVEVAAYEVQVDGAGVHAHNCLAWQPQAHRLAAAGSLVAYAYDVPAPYTAVLTKCAQGEAGHRDVIALFVCPLEPERSRVWFRLAVTDLVSSDDELHAFQDRIFGQDRAVLESQRPKRLPLGGGELMSAADRGSAAYRRWLREQGVSFGVC
jgi:phenylpropionate dioxygenase-like ring-hydroxylating dioxygenase large terminal subunit